MWTHGELDDSGKCNGNGDEIVVSLWTDAREREPSSFGGHGL